MSEAPWLDEARKFVGIKEIAGSRNEAKIVRFFAEAGHPEIQNDETAWCAAFAGAMLRRGGYKNSGSLLARSYEKFGEVLDEPKSGCVVVLKRGTGWQGHVGFYVGETDSRVRVLGGNQGNAVSIASFPKDRVIAYRWPTERVAPLHQSKIARIGAGIAAIETGDAANTATDAIYQVGSVKSATDSAGLTDYIVALATNPRFLIALAVVVAVAAIVWWRWRDHGAGGSQ